MIANLLTYIQGFGLVTKVMAAFGGIATLGFLGPFAPFAAAALSIVGSLIKWTWEGLVNVITHPVTLTIVLAAWLHGDWHGKKSDAQEVAVAKAQVTKLVKAQKDSNHAEELRAAAARAAAELEENKPVPPPAAPAASAAAVPAKPAGSVRHATSHRRETSSFAGLLGF